MRPPRIHVPGGLYYLVGRSRKPQLLFRDGEDYEQFKTLLAAAPRACRASLHAFCLLPEVFHLAVTIGSTSTGRLMAFLARRHVEASHRHYGDQGALLQPHHRALLVDSDYLLELVRFITWAGVRSGCVPDVMAWAHSSHHAYTRPAQLPWLDTDALLRKLDSDRELAGRKYTLLLATPTSEDFARGFERGLPGEPRVFGPPALLRRIGLDVRPALSRPLEDAIRAICLYCGVTHEELISVRALAYARGLTAWYAERRCIATLSQVARYFGCHWSTLRSAMRLHQTRAPELFDMAAIQRARPLLPMPQIQTDSRPPGGAPDAWWRSSYHAVPASRPLNIEQLPPHTSRRRRRTADRD